MLDPSGIAHLIFRNTVAEALEAVATGQANYAVAPISKQLHAVGRFNSQSAGLGYV